MRLKEYLELIELAHNDIYTHLQRRNRALVYKDELAKTKEDFIASILAYKNWLTQRYTRFSSQAMHYIQNISLILSVVVFLVGFGVGVGLLSYSGKEPVNVIYFMFVTIALPLLSSLWILIALLKTTSNSVWVKLSPAFWLEKLVSRFVDKHNQNYDIDPRVYNYLVIQRGVWLSILFYVAVLLALLVVVTTQDIAFAWSSTLDISSQEFAKLISYIALPWKDIAPYAIPSSTLVESSHLFRLGNQISSEMIHNASTLGQWWKFLAFGVLFYAICLRVVLYILATLRLKRAMRVSLESNSTLRSIYEDIHTPVVTTTIKDEVSNDSVESSLPCECEDTSLDSYSIALGWDISTKLLQDIATKYNLNYEQSAIIGSVDSFEAESKIVDSSYKDVLMVVKSWEPPVGDLWDFIEELDSDSVTLLLIGTKHHNYKASSQDIDIWSRQLAKQRFDNVRLKYE